MSMPPRPDPDNPIVEPPPDGADQDAGQQARELRIRQQETLAELGVFALKGPGFDQLLERTVQLAAEGLRAELCKILEYLPGENRLLLRAGVGWDPGLIGLASVGADLESPSGFALRTGKPVISNHLEHEERFRTPDLLKVHGVRRAINVILQGDGKPFGVLEVDSRSEGEFSEHDIAFLQGAANILGMAIERQRHERRLRAALEHQKLLVDEINHRVKNSLQLVASLFNLQATHTRDQALSQSLQEAIGRVTAVARIHERLYRSTDIANVDLAAYVADVCKDLAGLAPTHRIVFQAQGPLLAPTDRAVRIALLTTELVTNAAKHAYPEDSGGGAIFVGLTHRVENLITVSVRDEGRGLSDDLTTRAAEGLGMRIIKALSEQMEAKLVIHQHHPGTEFEIEIPLFPSKR